MESRTSPGKGGSVQPISESPVDASRFSQALVSRLSALVERYLSSSWGESGSP